MPAISWRRLFPHSPFLSFSIMNQYQNRSAEEQKTFLSKIKDNYSATFGNLSLTSSIQKASSHVDKDGSTETDTLIHKAFVKYFDSHGEAYPDWLGEPQRAGSAQAGRYANQGSAGGYRPQNGQSSQYKPVYTLYNTAERPQPSPTQSPQGSGVGSSVGGTHGSNSGSGSASYSTSLGSQGYKPRSSSRLQDMYNKSRQQGPGAGYTTNSPPSRSNSSTSGSRLRERMMHSGSMTGMSNHLDGGEGRRWQER